MNQFVPKMIFIYWSGVLHKLKLKINNKIAFKFQKSRSRKVFLRFGNRTLANR